MNRIAQILVAIALVTTPGAAIGGTSERVVTDRFSGLAISGFDPVAYFTDATPRAGREDIELSAEGAIWRFRNTGNRDSFAARPDIYAPRFGGYDPVDVARGVARAGRPQIWLVADGQLYLFGDADNRSAFETSVAASRRAAIEAWPAVEAQLAR